MIIEKKIGNAPETMFRHANEIFAHKISVNGQWKTLHNFLSEPV